MKKIIRIGTRESELAIWQASQVKDLLSQNGHSAELVFIKSEGDLDLTTPLYEMGVHGIFTRSLDLALLNNRVDIAVHSMKDVPTHLPAGIQQAAVLKRGAFHDMMVYKNASDLALFENNVMHVATSSLRRKAQWLNRYPHHQVHSLRGNINTRLRKLSEENWNAAIFAQAGLERIGLRPPTSEVIDWMLPAPAQGAIMVVCREDDGYISSACRLLNDETTALCCRIERDFLRILLGGCATPISALAVVNGNDLYFRGNILSLNGVQKINVEKTMPLQHSLGCGKSAAEEILNNGGQKIIEEIRHEVN